MSEKNLSKLQAYEAMFYFLENLYALTNDDSIGGFLGSMQLLNDGKPADPAYWSDWEKAVEKVLSKQGGSVSD